VTLLVFALSSCDKCKNVKCANGGVCKDGDCVCTNGYTGAVCETPPPPVVNNSNTSSSSSSSSSSSGGCTFTQWTNSGSCSSGYYPIIGGCCPSDRPYSFDGGGCFTSCSTAAADAGGKTIYKANLNNTGGGTCLYTQWTGTGSCVDSGYYPVYTGKCCASTNPYYNTYTGYCYTTCSNARSASTSGTIYRIND
jgi:hypothetical protein